MDQTKLLKRTVVIRSINGFSKFRKFLEIQNFVNSPVILRTSLTLYIIQGDYIWIEPVSRREFDVAIGARVVTAEGRRIQVNKEEHGLEF